MLHNSLTIVIPCYNEEESIDQVILSVLNFSRTRQYKVIVVNDGSVDGTLNILEKYKNRENFEVISHEHNRGYGAAIKTGILASNSEYIITIDADGQHILEDVDSMLKVATKSNSDLLIGKRPQMSSSPLKSSAKIIIRYIAKLLIGVSVDDLNSGMKLYKTKIVQSVVKYCPDGMSFSDTIVAVFFLKEMIVLEHNISIKEREYGVSKIRISTAFETLLSIINIAIFFNPLKFFIPVSLIFFLSGVAWGVGFIIDGKGVSVGTSFLLLASIVVFLFGLIAHQISLVYKALLQK